MEEKKEGGLECIWGGGHTWACFGVDLWSRYSKPCFHDPFVHILLSFSLCLFQYVEHTAQFLSL